MNDDGLPVYPLPLGRRLRGDWFPMYFDRLLGSRFVARHAPEVVGIGVILWCEAMRQDPAGTLPEDDVELARLAGYGRDLPAWVSVRAAGALYGFAPVLCVSADEGEAVPRRRLAHPVLTEVAHQAVERVLTREAANAAAGERSLASRMRKRMRDCGFHAGLIAREDVVQAVIEALRQPPRRWTEANVREATEAVSARLDAEADARVVGLRGAFRGGVP